MAANTHRQTKSVYRLRSHVYCVPCGLRMHGKRNHRGTAYSYCQPRGRPPPEGHPATVWVNERKLIAAVTQFFNTYVLGPDRLELAVASLPAAADHAMQAHREQGEGLQRRLAELQTSADNLLRALEKSADTDGHIFERIRRRMNELDQEAAQVSHALVAHRAAAPSAPADDITLLNQLPLVQIDLNLLAADRAASIPRRLPSRDPLRPPHAPGHASCRDQRRHGRATGTRGELGRTADQQAAKKRWSGRRRTRRAQFWKVPPAGFEPALPPPEGGALSPELRGLSDQRRVPGTAPDLRTGDGWGYEATSGPPPRPARSWAADTARCAVAGGGATRLGTRSRRPRRTPSAPRRRSAGAGTPAAAAGRWTAW
jgi:hypothetical protein